eukprot:gene15863-biopygen3714
MGTGAGTENLVGRVRWHPWRPPQKVGNFEVDSLDRMDFGARWNPRPAPAPPGPPPGTPVGSPKANALRPGAGRCRLDAKGGHLGAKKSSIQVRWNPMMIGYGALAAPPESRKFRD